ncbi:MAG: YicC family protein [Flavobacteriales bacterium]|nr:YicC family protein [Bacteroidota bacterium]MCB9240720.1 YicC family protein [Flavobacteriales bacterium]
MRSMTGYGSAEMHTEHIDVKVEIKSLNGKFLELNLRTPRNLGDREIELRQFFTKQLERGSVLCTVSIDQKAGTSSVQINRELAAAYYSALRELATDLGAADRDIFRTVVNMPDVLKNDEGSLNDDQWALVKTCCEQALEKFNQFRNTEGEELRQMLLGHNALIMQSLPEIEPLEAARKKQVTDKLRSALEENKDLTNDANRFEQELIYYLEKLDISEEKNRLTAHCKLFDEEIRGTGNGKKLGFIAQEMGREINTLGSKANYAPIQEIVIRMKEELEKIKEQTLNVL